MSRRIGFAAILFFLVPFAAFAQAPQSDFPPPSIYVSTGSTGQIVLVSPDPANPGEYLITEVASGKGGFRPEEMAFGADGLYVCDQSNSEIFRVGLNGTIDTLYERDTATSPFDPEQPAGCTLRPNPSGVGTDLLFISRRGQGKNYKTGIWRLPNVVGATQLPIIPELPLPLDDPDTANDLAIDPDGNVYFTFGNQIFVVTNYGETGQVVNEFLANNVQTLGEAFGIAISDTGDDFEVYAASRYQGVVQGFRSDGTWCTDVTYPAGNPSSLEFDIVGDMWSVAASRSNGRGGIAYKVEQLSCATNSYQAEQVVSLDAAVGVALGPNLGTASIAIGGTGKTPNADVCTTLFNVNPQIFNGPNCTVNLTCRLIELEEFADRSLIHFPSTSCTPLAGSGGTFCAEMRISIVDSDEQPSPQCIQDVITNWIVDLEPGPVFRPGVLYSPGPQDFDGSFNDFDEDIFTAIDLYANPSNPNDPRYEGERIELGSGVVTVNGVPNKVPTADAGADQTIPICTDPTLLTLSGSATDPDEGVEWKNGFNVIGPMEGPGYDYLWSGPGINAANQSEAAPQVDVTGFASGFYEYTLMVTDKPNDGVAPESDTDKVTVEIVNEPPTIGQVDVSPKVLWPPSHKLEAITIDVVEFTDACGGAVTGGECRIKSVASDDPDNGTGDGNTDVDWVINEVAGGGTAWGDLAVQVMSERAEAGQDRIYTITLECRDSFGRLAEKEVFVRVSDNQGGGN